MDDPNPSTSTPKEPAQARPPLRLRPLAVIFGLAALAIATAAVLGTYWENLQSGIPWFIVYATVIVTFLAVVGWLLLASGISSPVKWSALIASLIAIAAAFATVKMDFDGDLTPTFRFRWRATGLVIDNPKPIQLTPTPQDVPGFLGPNRRPEFRDVRLETDWTKNPPREVWRRPIGRGFSSFAVVGDFAFTQQQDGSDELVVCYEWKTGKTRWKHADPASFASSLGGDGPRATPTIDDGRVYSVGATGILNCLDSRNGARLWSADTLAQNQALNLDWGISCSPLVVDGLVVVSAGRSDTSLTARSRSHYSLIAYDKVTGKPVWRGGTDDASYCSPALLTLGSVRQIVIANAGTITGHDLADGHVLWKFDWQREQPTVSQVVQLDNERVFVSKGYGAGCGVRRITRDAAGKWSVPDVQPDDDTSGWTAATHLRTKFTNVVVRGEQVYGLDDGFLECLDLADGRPRWTTRRHRKADYKHGQVLLVGDVLLVQTEQGDIALVEAEPAKFHELSRFKVLSGRTWNYPVLVGNYLLTRNDREAVCYELPKK